MNPLILLFKTYYLPPFLFGYGVEGRGFSLYFTSGYSGSCIRLSIQYTEIYRKGDLHLRCF